MKSRETKYKEAVARNMHRAPCLAALINCSPGTRDAKLHKLKIKLGIRQKDTAHDESLVTQLVITAS